MRAFRSPGMEKMIEAMGLETFFEKSFGGHVDLSAIPDEEKKAYLDDWSRPGALTAMLNWYRASKIEVRSEEHTSELQSLMRISYAVFCLKKKKNDNYNKTHDEYNKTIH